MMEMRNGLCHVNIEWMPDAGTTATSTLRPLNPCQAAEVCTSLVVVVLDFGERRRADLGQRIHGLSPVFAADCRVHCGHSSVAGRGHGWV